MLANTLGFNAVKSSEHCGEFSAKQPLQKSRDDIKTASALLKCLSNEYRLYILYLLLEHGEMSFQALQDKLDLRQSVVSQSLARLRQENLVVRRHEHRQVFYRLRDQQSDTALHLLFSLFCTNSEGSHLKTPDQAVPSDYEI